MNLELIISQLRLSFANWYWSHLNWVSDRGAESNTFFKRFRINRIFEKWFGKVFSNYIWLGNVWSNFIYIKCTLKNLNMKEMLTKFLMFFAYVFCRLMICINACVSIYFGSTQKGKIVSKWCPLNTVQGVSSFKKIKKKHNIYVPALHIGWKHFEWFEGSFNYPVCCCWYRTQYINLKSEYKRPSLVNGKNDETKKLTEKMCSM